MEVESACWKCNAGSHLSSCEGSHVKGLRERLLRVTEELPAWGWVVFWGLVTLHIGVRKGFAQP